MRVVAGVGFRSEALSAEIVALVREAVRLAALPEGRLAGLATAARLAGSQSFGDAARRLAVPPLAIAPEALAAADRRVETRSDRALAAHGIGSVAEAAALAAAGPGSRLLVKRIASASVTCALAVSAGP